MHLSSSDWQAFAFLWHPAVLTVLGLCIGSFLNVVVHRLPLMMERDWTADAAAHLADAETTARSAGASAADARDLALRAERLGQQLASQPRLGIARPRSRCPQCGHAIAWYENLPLLGWLMLRGRCSACKSPISLRYPLLELLTGLIFNPL